MRLCRHCGNALTVKSMSYDMDEIEWEHFRKNPHGVECPKPDPIPLPISNDDD